MQIYTQLIQSSLINNLINKLHWADLTWLIYTLINPFATTSGLSQQTDE